MINNFDRLHAYLTSVEALIGDKRHTLDIPKADIALTAVRAALHGACVAKGSTEFWSKTDKEVSYILRNVFDRKFDRVIKAYQAHEIEINEYFQEDPGKLDQIRLKLYQMVQAKAELGEDVPLPSTRRADELVVLYNFITEAIGLAAPQAYNTQIDQRKGNPQKNTGCKRLLDISRRWMRNFLVPMSYIPLKVFLAVFTIYSLLPISRDIFSTDIWLWLLCGMLPSIAAYIWIWLFLRIGRYLKISYIFLSVLTTYLAAPVLQFAVDFSIENYLELSIENIPNIDGWIVFVLVAATVLFGYYDLVDRREK